MGTNKPHSYEEWDDLDQAEGPMFQPLRKQTGKPQTVKDARKQQGKEWGRTMHKFHKQRSKNGKP